MLNQYGDRLKSVKFKAIIVPKYNRLERAEKFKYLRCRFNAIFNTFNPDDFADPLTSKTILVALENIRTELTTLLRH